MKKFTKLCCLILCIVLSGLISCKSPASSESTTTEISFESYIQELKNEIRKNPTEYIGRAVSLKGTFIIQDGQTVILDYHKMSYTLSERVDANNHVRVDKNTFKIALNDTLENSLLHSWDYVELSGTIAVSNGEIYLDNCLCTIIVTDDERTQVRG